MLKRKHLFLLFMIVPVLLLALVVVQWYWMKDTYRLREISFNTQVNAALANAVRTLEHRLFSWNLYSKIYLTRGQGLMLFRHIHGSGGLTDTMTMYNAFPYPDRPDTCFYKTNSTYFDEPTLVDVNLRIERLGEQDLMDMPFKSFPTALSEENYRSLLDEPERLARQLSGLDTILKQALLKEGIDTSLSFAVTRNGAANVLMSGGVTGLLPELLKSSFHTELFANRPFIQPYKLHVVIHNQGALILNSMRLLLLLSAILVVGLCGVFIYFFVIVLRQKKLSEMKTDFINNMTHEFMTPVTNIGLAIETLERQRSDETSKRKIMNMIANENNHLRDNINKVLQAATMDRGSYDTYPVNIDVHAMLRKVVQSFALNLDLVKGEAVLNLEAGEPVIKADETHLVNLFYNVIDNCIKYRSQGRGLTLQISTENSPKGIKVTIADNGQGMAHTVQKHAFNKFYRGSKGDTHDVKGFGLGLNYVKSIANAYGWEMELKSEEGKGTTFIIWLK